MIERVHECDRAAERVPKQCALAEAELAYQSVHRFDEEIQYVVGIGFRRKTKSRQVRYDRSIAIRREHWVVAFEVAIATRAGSAAVKEDDRLAAAGFVIVDREPAVGCDVLAFGNWVGASGHRILRVALASASRSFATASRSASSEQTKVLSNEPDADLSQRTEMRGDGIARNHFERAAQ